MEDRTTFGNTKARGRALIPLGERREGAAPHLQPTPRFGQSRPPSAAEGPSHDSRIPDHHADRGVHFPGTGEWLLHAWLRVSTRAARASVMAAIGCTSAIVPHYVAASVLGLAALMHNSALGFPDAEVISASSTCSTWPGRCGANHRRVAIAAQQDRRTAQGPNADPPARGILITCSNPKLNSVTFPPCTSCRNSSIPGAADANRADAHARGCVLALHLDRPSCSTGWLAAQARDHVIARPKVLRAVRRIVCLGVCSDGPAAGAGGALNPVFPRPGGGPDRRYSCYYFNRPGNSNHNYISKYMLPESVRWKIDGRFTRIRSRPGRRGLPAKRTAPPCDPRSSKGGRIAFQRRGSAPFSLHHPATSSDRTQNPVGGRAADRSEGGWFIPDRFTLHVDIGTGFKVDCQRVRQKGSEMRRALIVRGTLTGKAAPAGADTRKRV